MSICTGQRNGVDDGGANGPGAVLHPGVARDEGHDTFGDGAVDVPRLPPGDLCRWRAAPPDHADSIGRDGGPGVQHRDPAAFDPEHLGAGVDGRP